jgi:Na+-transporting NADH:ubiquinone oxidoreductase subunit C
MSPVPAALKRFYPLVFMLGLTLVFMSAVTGAHLATRDAVERNRTLFLKRAVLQAAGLPAPEDNAAAEAFYKESVTPGDGENHYAVADPAGAIRVTAATGSGLWGKIDAMVGFRADGTLAGLAFTAQNETPGLGARIEEAWFLGQFKGKRPPLELVPEGTRSQEPAQIDAVTGASITSRAVRDIVNGAAGGPAEGGDHGGG